MYGATIGILHAAASVKVNPQPSPNVVVRNTSDAIIIPKGLQVPSNYSIEFYDSKLGQYVLKTNITLPVTNYEYETNLNEEKRNIFNQLSTNYFLWKQLLQILHYSQQFYFFFV